MGILRRKIRKVLSIRNDYQEESCVFLITLTPTWLGKLFGIREKEKKATYIKESIYWYDVEKEKRVLFDGKLTALMALSKKKPISQERQQEQEELQELRRLILEAGVYIGDHISWHADHDAEVEQRLCALEPNSASPPQSLWFPDETEHQSIEGQEAVTPDQPLGLSDEAMEAMRRQAIESDVIRAARAAYRDATSNSVPLTEFSTSHIEEDLSQAVNWHLGSDAAAHSFIFHPTEREVSFTLEFSRPPCRHLTVDLLEEEPVGAETAERTDIVPNASPTGNTEGDGRRILDSLTDLTRPTQAHLASLEAQLLQATQQGISDLAEPQTEVLHFPNMTAEELLTSVCSSGLKREEGDTRKAIQHYFPLAASVSISFDIIRQEHNITIQVPTPDQENLLFFAYSPRTETLIEQHPGAFEELERLRGNRSTPVQKQQEEKEEVELDSLMRRI